MNLQKPMERANRNPSIDIWKFVFAIVILIHHGRKLRGDDVCIFLGGSIGVEFFFIVSGFLMVQSVVSKQDVLAGKTIGQNTFEYVRKKFVPLLPEIFFAWCIAFTVTEIYRNVGLRAVIYDMLSSVWSIFMLDFSGVAGFSVNGVTWYISALLIISLILYPILLKSRDLFLYVVAPLIILFCFGYLYQNFSNPRNPTVWLGFVYKGMVRGIAEVCLGAVCYPVCCVLKRCQFTKFAQILFASTENICYGIVLYTAYAKKATNFDYILILLLAVAITIGFSEQSAIYPFLNANIAEKLSKFGFSLYLCHNYWADCLGEIFAELDYWPLMGIYTCAALITTCFLIFIMTIYRKWSHIARRTIKRYIIAE